MLAKLTGNEKLKLNSVPIHYNILSDSLKDLENCFTVSNVWTYSLFQQKENEIWLE